MQNKSVNSVSPISEKTKYYLHHQSNRKALTGEIRVTSMVGKTSAIMVTKKVPALSNSSVIQFISMGAVLR